MLGNSVDVLIVGGGIMAAGVARQLRDARPGARILMVDAGTVIGSVAGQHLHDSPDEAIWSRYNARVSTGVQSHYLGAETTADIGPTVVGAEPGIYNLSAFGADADAMPASAVAWNAGGMGVHWTAATPWPFAFEAFAAPGAPEGQWQADLASAQKLLHVDPHPYSSGAPGDTMIAALDEVFGPASAEGRHPQPMPMAVTPTTGTDASGTDMHAATASPSGEMLRTGPNRIFEPIATGGDPLFELRPGTLCTRLEYAGGHVSGATVRTIETGETYLIEATVVVVCADTIRTPQLLWASGIRPEALGQNLNEHAFLSGRVTADHERLGIDLGALTLPREGEHFIGSYWLPTSGEGQPFHGQIMDSPVTDEAGEIVGYAVGLSWYVPTETRAANRLEFSDTELDPAGMPRLSVHFSYSDADLALIERGRQSQALAGRALGDFDPDRDSALLAAGSSLHYTGTVRLGPVDDGTSVCDVDARVWGFDNLYLAGNGVVPTPLACNSTLTGMITAVRASRAAARHLPA